MSVHSEVQNLRKNKSGNAVLSIHRRAGDSEEGSEYFDLVASGEPSALEVAEEKDERKARQKFLYQYFTLLKERLNRFEFEYIKQLYAEGQAESVICDNLGLNPKKFKRGLQRKLTASAEDIAALVEASDWDDAELFSQCFLSAPQDIQDVNEAAYLPKTVKGFGNLIERLAYHRYRKIYKAEWYKRRRYIKPLVSIKLTNKYNRYVKERVRCIAVMFRTLSYDFLFNATDAFNLAPDREKLAGFEKFFNAIYNTISESIDGLYKIVVDEVPCFEIERAERERYKERCKAREENERIANGGEL